MHFAVYRDNAYYILVDLRLEDLRLDSIRLEGLLLEDLLLEDLLLEDLLLEGIRLGFLFGVKILYFFHLWMPFLSACMT